MVIGGSHACKRVRAIVAEISADFTAYKVLNVISVDV
jgi:hypothetical protein